MRLLDTKTFVLKDFIGSNTPPYAILSHTWEDDEVLFQDMGNLDLARRKKGWSKVERCCEQARNDAWDWVWIDTCCIDKSSSAELSESINSMFKWYRRAMVCYAYLSDVANRADFKRILTFIKPGLDLEDKEKGFEQPIRWFYRSWTLQELIAPLVVHFFGASWCYLGSKKGFTQQLSESTGIDSGVLNHTISLGSISAATKMWWACSRTATRVEDVSYSLLGIFDVNMPLIYGEGDKAFLRLQQHILQATEDHSLLAFDLHMTFLVDSFYFRNKPIARSPQDFSDRVAFSPIIDRNGGNPRFVYDSHHDGPSLKINLPVMRVARNNSNLKIEFEHGTSGHDPYVTLAALNLLASREDKIDGTTIFYPRQGTFGKLDWTPQRDRLSVVLMLLTRNDDRNITEKMSQYILVPHKEVQDWPKEECYIVFNKDQDLLVNGLGDGLEPQALPASLCPAASDNSYRIADYFQHTSYYRSRRQFYECYWVLTCPGRVSTFAWARVNLSSKRVAWNIEPTPTDDLMEYLRRKRYGEGPRDFELPDSTPAAELRMALDDELDVVLVLERGEAAAGKVPVKILFKVQKSLSYDDAAQSKWCPHPSQQGRCACFSSSQDHPPLPTWRSGHDASDEEEAYGKYSVSLSPYSSYNERL
ncbi:uncharacterized protein JN550_002694 [Neoarthrinium moseri]|uniref:uncharacterized protein n=1 Tax=Neoarthrinium moseri TaxID=1658444 RepID=UPI001FDD9744|nr:uncharacterized protein JN550_002694 [Neoarthrinium moseri]KAI1874115.1 hypothetical protein JN550_002694 [Neoarthrinium moseri]